MSPWSLVTTVIRLPDLSCDRTGPPFSDRNSQVWRLQPLIGELAAEHRRLDLRVLADLIKLHISALQDIVNDLSPNSAC